MNEASLSSVDPGNPGLAFLGALRLALRRLGRTGYMLNVAGLAVLPLALVVLVTAASWRNPLFADETRAQAIYQSILRVVGLHFVAFFTAYVMGQAVVRQDLDDETLHYVFLQPIPRWLLFVARALAGIALAGIAVTVGFCLCWVALTVPWISLDELASLLYEKGRLAGLLRETGVLLLAVLLYGSASIAFGSFLRSAFFSLILVGWEAGVYYLPQTLKLWTGSHYFHSLLPQAGVERKLFELVGEPAGVTLCLTVIFVASLVFLAIGAVAYHLRECQYSKGE